MGFQRAFVEEIMKIAVDTEAPTKIIPRPTETATKIMQRPTESAVMGKIKRLRVAAMKAGREPSEQRVTSLLGRWKMAVPGK